MSKKLKAEFTVKFAPVTPEMEEAYWFAIHYFAEVLRKYMLEESTAPKIEDNGCEETIEK